MEDIFYLFFSMGRYRRYREYRRYRYIFLHRSISKISRISKISYINHGEKTNYRILSFFLSIYRRYRRYRRYPISTMERNYNIIVDCPGDSIDDIGNQSEILGFFFSVDSMEKKKIFFSVSFFKMLLYKN